MDTEWPETLSSEQEPVIEDTPLFADDLPPSHRSGFVPLVGKGAWQE